jgi:hypothetical protein
MTGIKAFFTVLLIMPLGHAVTMLAYKLPLPGQISIIIIGTLVAALLIYATKYIASPAWETFVGMISGVLLWASLVEIGVKLGAKAIAVEENKAVEFSLAVIIPFLLYLLFNEQVRCNFFISLRKYLRITRKEMPDIAIDHWGPRVAFKMFAMIWIGHVALFFAYDKDIFGPQGQFCKLFFIFCLFAGTYLFYRLTKAREMAFAFRYAMPTVIVIWSCIETLVKWKIFSEPWITLNPVFMITVIAAFIGIIVFITLSERRKKGLAN